jgi:DNA polymerase III delta prime subunit
MLAIHPTILEKLNYFYEIHKIPNIIFHGPSGSGKRTIVNEFIQKIYDGDKEKIKNMVMNVNCAHGKGIKFIREELKFFAKTHIFSNGGDFFKSILLFNADKLTTDAQSALRRCIELFTHNTRFFIIVEDKYKLLKPILSRFCEIYIPEPVINNVSINLYKYNIQQTFSLKEIKNNKIDNLKKEINKFLKENGELMGEIDIQKLIEFSSCLYEKGFSGLDIMNLIENSKIFDLTIKKKYELLLAFNKVKKEFRNEKLFILFIFHFLLVDKEYSLENCSFI